MTSPPNVAIPLATLSPEGKRLANCQQDSGIPNAQAGTEAALQKAQKPLLEAIVRDVMSNNIARCRVRVVMNLLRG
jgi:hypothetical protein